MYQFIIPSRIGDYVIDKTDKLERVYEITGITATITFNYQTGEEDIKVIFEVLDAKDPSSVYKLIDSAEMRHATRIETDSYILDEYISSEEDDEYALDNLFENKSFEEQFESRSTDESLEKDIEEKDVQAKVTRTTDNILDEYLYYKDLLEILGDEDGKCKHEMDKLHIEFIEITNKNS